MNSTPSHRPTKGWLARSSHESSFASDGSWTPYGETATTSVHYSSSTPATEVVVVMDDGVPAELNAQQHHTSSEKEGSRWQAASYPWRSTASLPEDPGPGPARALFQSPRTKSTDSIPLSPSSKERSFYAATPSSEIEMRDTKATGLAAALKSLSKPSTVTPAAIESVIPPRKPLRYGWKDPGCWMPAALKPPVPHAAPPCGADNSQGTYRSAALPQHPGDASDHSAPSTQKQESKTDGKTKTNRSATTRPVAPLRHTTRFSTCVAKIAIPPHTTIEVELFSDDDVAALSSEIIRDHRLAPSLQPAIMRHLESELQFNSQKKSSTHRNPEPSILSVQPAELSWPAAQPHSAPPPTAEAPPVAPRGTRTTSLREAERVRRLVEEQEQKRKASFFSRPVSKRSTRTRSTSSVARRSTPRVYHTPETRSSLQREVEEHCTFHPKINRYHVSRSRSVSYEKQEELSSSPVDRPLQTGRSMSGVLTQVPRPVVVPRQNRSNETGESHRRHSSTVEEDVYIIHHRFIEHNDRIPRTTSSHAHHYLDPVSHTVSLASSSQERERLPWPPFSGR